MAQEAKEKAEALVRSQEIDQKKETLERKRAALEAQIQVLKMDFSAEELELERIILQRQSREKQLEMEPRRHESNSFGEPGDEERVSPWQKSAGDPS